MEKLYYLIIFTIALTILMQLAGIQYAGQTEVINWLGLDVNNFNPKTSTFYLALTAPIIGLFIVAAAIGAVLSGKESAIRASFAAGIMGIGIGTFVGILQHVKDIADDWIFYLVFLIFSIYIIAYILAILEWWSNG